ncbi:MAG: xanthine dehydrogenase family protein molybdopterin-binding subunit [Pseudomonadales bacterium]
MSEAREFAWIGTRPVRPDGVDKVTGRANFGADFSLPGMLVGKVLRSTHAHARIKRIDLGPAREIPGVLAVVSGDDFPPLDSGARVGGLSDLAENCMARDRALYHGHAIAAVAAVSNSVAMQALDAIVVEYEPLPVVRRLTDAIAPGAPVLHDDLFTEGLEETPDTPSNIARKHTLSGGHLEQGFTDADIIIEHEFATPTVHQGYIEPHACVVSVTESGDATVWCSTQGHFGVRGSTAHLLDMDVSKVKVIPSEIGGGFGGKLGIYLEPVALLLSKKSLRPVKMTMSREEVFRASGPASATRSRIKLGARRDGTLTAMQAELWYEAGPFKSAGAPMRPGCMCVFAAYRCENFLIEGYSVVVNMPKVAAYRAPGAPQAVYAAECAMDELARALEMDPIDLRLKNAVSEGSQATYGPKFQAVGMIECLEAARNHPNYKIPLGENEGRGLGIGFWFNGGNQSSAEVHLNEDGTVTVVEGNPDIGGSRASMALMCAEELGVPYERIHVVVADTEGIGYNNATGGSRTTFATGMAVIEAAKDVKRQLKQRAALTWNIDEDQVDWVDGCAVPKPGVNVDVKKLTVPEIAAGAARTGGPISGQASLTAQGPGPGFSVNFTDLRVDPETGKIEVLRFTAIQDAGKAIHPDYVEGQMQGGAVQGLGWALNEEYVWDEDGVVDNAGFLDYRVPVASDVPMIDTHIIEVANPNHPYGVRGVGETPIVAPLAAVANAFRDATGVRIHDLPMSPPKVLKALEARG